MTKNMEKLVNLIQNDESVQKELTDQAVKEQSEVIEFAKSHGIELTAEDFNTELSESELAKVAGGFDWTLIPCCILAGISCLTR